MHDSPCNSMRNSANTWPSGIFLRLLPIITVCTSSWNWLSKMFSVCVRACGCVQAQRCHLPVNAQNTEFKEKSRARITMDLKKAWACNFHSRGRRRKWVPLKTESKLLSNSSLQQLCDIDQTVNTKDTTGEPLPHDKHMGGFLTGLFLTQLLMECSATH